MQYYLTLLRFLHIGPGVFWAGGVFYMAFFVMPAIRKLGPEGGKFMQQLARTNSMPNFMTTLGLITLTAGLLLLWEVSGHFSGEWLLSLHGITLLFGAAAGITALTLGFVINKPAAERIGQLGAEIAKAGGPPTPAQTQELGMLRNRVSFGTNMIATFIGLAVAAMAIVRYL